MEPLSLHGCGWGRMWRGDRGRAAAFSPLIEPTLPLLQDSLSCRLVFLLMQYCVAANYYWLLVEGVYLYTLLVFSVFSEQRVFRLYLSIGWGEAMVIYLPPPTHPAHRRPHPARNTAGDVNPCSTSFAELSSLKGNASPHWPNPTSFPPPTSPH